MTRIRFNNRITSKTLVVAAVTAVVLSPVAASAATDSANTTITTNIGSSITVTTSGSVALNVTPDGDGQASSASDTVLVSTNNSGGYNLVLENGDTDTNLTNGGNTIAAHAGTQASPTTLANNSWGYRVDSVGGFGAGPTSGQTNQDNLAGAWAGVLSSATAGATLKTTASTATNDSTTVWYGVKADSTKPDGAYADTVTYTATTN